MVAAPSPDPALSPAPPLEAGPGLELAGEDDGSAGLERLYFEAEDLACGPSGPTGPWRLTAAAGGRQLNDPDFVKPLDLDWVHFSIQIMREVLAEGGAIHFDLTHLRGLPDILDGEGAYGSAVTSRELRWLRGRWERDAAAAIVFWTEVEYRGEEAWGRQVPPPWEWSPGDLARHEARLAEIDEAAAA